MNNKLITVILLGFIIILFTIYFISINLTLRREFLSELNRAEQYAQNEEYEDVLTITKDLQKDWEKNKYWLMFNYAEAEFAMFEEHLNYIIGGAEAQEHGTILGNIKAAKNEWKNATKIVPEP